MYCQPIVLQQSQRWVLAGNHLDLMLCCRCMLNDFRRVADVSDAAAEAAEQQLAAFEAAADEAVAHAHMTHLHSL
jgi:hypothetical protein